MTPPKQQTEENMAHFHRTPSGNLYVWIDLAGRSFGATYAPGRFDGLASDDVISIVTADILTLVQAEYAKNPNSFRLTPKASCGNITSVAMTPLKQ
jgi:hypothetical protein